MRVRETKYVKKQKTTNIWLVRYCSSSSLDLLWTNNCSSPSFIKSSTTLHTIGISTSVGSTSTMHKVSSSTWFATWWSTTILDTYIYWSSTSFTSGTSHLHLFWTTWTIFQLAPFFGFIDEKNLMYQDCENDWFFKKPKKWCVDRFVPQFHVCSMIFVLTHVNPSTLQ